ncbi:transport and Golgi organization protein 1 homolog isoform X2 [Sturnira hondurensis]|uniref:transport and Golgi organization protein 1 homolog isoform X2 n=1 Tax=Sturnira hondurensis TaxID=192404 RepID=UPI00187A8CA9|nr:transport and Golgi organization protein 1 homolog isoform X2 [Sturnira hondurensis]
MAAAPGLPLWLLLLGMPWRVPGHPEPDLDRRFSEHKLCADADCSMLMYRGEALQDFTGPDCRFVNFKKGDNVYVYYKLAGNLPEVWAGSVGRIFGYFPKALIKVAHTYTKKELQVPADETDFVCFDGGKDDFDNYNLEELLGFLASSNFATGDSKKTIEKTSQHVEKPPGVSEEGDPAPDSDPATTEGRHGAFPGNAAEQEENYEAQETRPQASGHTDHLQGEGPSLESFEEMLQDKLKVQDSENNKTSNSSQISNEQEKMDAYTLLKKEMTLDLKTKFGSTADALVSDDETTRLVTSLEDDFDEELDAEYYVIGKEEEEEDQENFDEIPLLTYTDEEDLKMPATPEAGKYSTDQEQNSSEEDKVEAAQPLHMKNDEGDPAAWEDTVVSTVVSTVPEGEERTGVDFESYNSEEEQESDDGLVPDSKWGKPQLPTDHADSKKAADGLPVAEVPKANNERDPEMDPEPHDTGSGRTAEESERSLVQAKKGLEDAKKEDRTLHSPTPSSNLNLLVATEKGKETLKSVFGNKEQDPKRAAVPIPKGMVREEKPGEPILEGGSEGGWEHKAAGNQVKDGKIQQEPRDVAPLLGGGQHNASKDGMEQEVGTLVNGPKAHTVSGEHLSEKLKEEQLLKTQNQPRFSSPDEIGLSTGLEDEGPVLGRNLSWQQEQDVAAVVSTPVSEKTRPSADEVTGDAVGRESVRPKPDTPGAETVGQRGSAEGPGPRTEKPEADDADYALEELLEDENAASAKQSRGKSPERQDGQLEVPPQVPERGVLGAMNNEAETEANKEEASNSLEIDRKNETVGQEEGTLGKEPGGLVVGKEESPAADRKAQSPSDGSDFPGEKTHQTPESGEMFENSAFASATAGNPEDRLKTSGLTETPGVGLSREGPEDGEKLADTQSPGAAPAERDGGHASQGAAGPAAESESSGPSAPLPIISSFFKEQQSMQRFQKYFDAHELEAIFQEMSSALKSAQQESPPYSVEKALDKVFRASESRILSAAEEMLDARVTKLRASGVKENVFEEAAVLDDVQDLIYFVRYRHSAGRGTGPPPAAQPSERGWDGPAEAVQPPLEDNPSQENTEDLKMQIPEEPSHLDQPITSNTGVSEVSQEPNTEKDGHPGLFVTESTADDDDDDDDDDDEEEEMEPPDEEPVENALLFLQSLVSYVTRTLLSTLPGDAQSAPDFYGLPWKPVLLTAFLGIVSFVIFFWRTILAVKSHVYQVTEQQISEKLNNLKKENADLVQKLSNYEQKIKESKKYAQETKKQNMILSDEANKYKDKIKELEEAKESLNDKAKNLRLMLESEREQNAKNEDLIQENKRSLDKLKDVIAMNASELSEVQIALNEAKLSEEKVKFECHRVQEENTKLKKKKDQLQQEIKDLKKAYTELNEQIRSFEKSQKDLEGALTQKEDNISALTNCITQLNWLDCESESEHQNKTGNESDELANGEVGGDRSEKMKSQIKQMMDVSRTQTEISVLEEDLKLLQLKLRASISSKCNLEDQVKKLEDDRGSLQSAKAGLEDENKTLKQKVEILNELYQQKEMALQKKLSQEEFERREREQRLSAADEKALSAAEEIKTYRWRIEELENELQKTERSFKDQLAANEKKAHDNWLKARAAERAMAEERREAANLRHKLLELNQKVAMLQREPVIVKPMPGRPSAQNPPRRGPLSQNGSFGPSPVSGGECSPPLRDPPARPLSATLSRKDVPRDPGSGAAAVVNSSPRSSSPARGMEGGKHTVPQESEGPSITPLAEHPVAVNMAAEGPPPFPGAPLMSPPMGGPVPPPIRYGPPPQLCGPFGPRPFPPPFGPGMRPPLGLREYGPGIPPGKRDVPFDPRGFVPGHPHFRPAASPGPREYFIPGPRPPPPPAHGPQDHPPPAARDLLPSGSREEPPPASQSSSQDASQALKQSP